MCLEAAINTKKIKNKRNIIERELFFYLDYLKNVSKERLYCLKNSIR